MPHLHSTAAGPPTLLHGRGAISPFVEIGLSTLGSGGNSDASATHEGWAGVASSSATKNSLSLLLDNRFRSDIDCRLRDRVRIDSDLS
jgi:hypothetical protein